MNFINRLSFNPLSVTQEPQSEVPSAPTPEPQQVTSLGVGGIRISLRMPRLNSPNNFYYLQQQAQSAALIEPRTTREQTVDASSVFSFFEPSVPQLNNRLPQLMDQLNSLRAKKRELRENLEQERQERFEKQKAVDSIQESIDSDQPIPDSAIATLSSLGILGMIGGLPALPVIGAIAGMFGMSLAYKEKARQAKAELEKKAGESDLKAEELQLELTDLDKEMDSAREAIAKEQARLEREAQPAKEQTISTDAIVQEPVWQEFLPDQNVVQQNQDLVQQENTRFSFFANPLLQKKTDES